MKRHASGSVSSISWPDALHVYKTVNPMNGYLKKKKKSLFNSGSPKEEKSQNLAIWSSLSLTHDKSKLF